MTFSLFFGEGVSQTGGLYLHM